MRLFIAQSSIDKTEMFKENQLQANINLFARAVVRCGNEELSN